ncbi:MAG: hypothetical protein AAF744_14020 [Pseudomonadota bacterium]
MRQVNGQTAEDVSQMLLDLTGEALLSNRFETFAACFHLPHMIETADQKRVLRTRRELQAVFDSVTDDYRRKRITALVRVCDVAEFKSDTCVHATHTTHMMAGQQRIGEPFPNFTVIEHIDGRWQCTSTQYAVDNKTTVGLAMSKMAHDPRG